MYNVETVFIPNFQISQWVSKRLSKSLDAQVAESEVITSVCTSAWLKPQVITQGEAFYHRAFNLLCTVNWSLDTSILAEGSEDLIRDRERTVYICIFFSK